MVGPTSADRSSITCVTAPLPTYQLRYALHDPAYRRKHPSPASVCKSVPVAAMIGIKSYHNFYPPYQYSELLFFNTAMLRSHHRQHE